MAFYLLLLLFMFNVIIVGTNFSKLTRVPFIVFSICFSYIYVNKRPSYGSEILDNKKLLFSNTQ